MSTQAKIYSLQDIKKIVGLKEPSNDNDNKETNSEPIPASENQSVNTTATTTEKADTLSSDSDFEELTSARKPWQSGWVKLILVGGLLGVLALIGGVTLKGLAGIRLSDKSAPEGVVVAVETDTEELTEQSQEQQIADLKTANALGNQSTVLEGQPQRTTEIRSQAQTETETETPATSSNPTEPTTATREAKPSAETVVARPSQIRPRRPVAVSRPPSVPQTTTVVSALPTPRPTPNYAVTRQTVVQPAAEVDPFEARERLSQLGSYGQGQSSAVSSATIPTEIASSAITVTDNQPIPISVNYSKNVTSQTENRNIRKPSRPLPDYMETNRGRLVVEAETTPTEELAASRATADIQLSDLQPEPNETDLLASTDYATYESGTDFIMRNSTTDVQNPVTEILPGISAVGRIVSPVAWAGDIASTAGAIELTEDLISNGAVIMPAGTQLMVSLQEMSNSGMVRLEVTSIVLSARSYEHMQIPGAAITVQGAGGRILMAKEISGNENDLNRLDLNQALLGALGQVGGLLNRPRSSSSAIGFGGAASSTQYGSPNIVGAILEGSTNNLINQRVNRNQARQDAIERRPPVWVLESGTDVEIFINQTVTL